MSNSKTAILQIVRQNNDYFYEVNEEKLLMLEEVLPLKKREEALMLMVTPQAITSTACVEYVLVLDGVEDEASWEELFDK